VLDVTVLDISIVVVNNLLCCYTCNDLECCFYALLICCSCKFMMDVHKLVVTLGTCTVSIVIILWFILFRLIGSSVLLKNNIGKILGNLA